MKKLTLAVTLVFVLCIAPVTHATMDLGFKVGGGMSKVNLTGVDFKAGADGGIFLNIKPSTSFSIQPEVLFTMKGMKIDLMGVGDYKWNFTYIEVPILIKRTLQTQGKIKPTFFAGPTIGFLSTAKQKVSIPLLGTDEETDIKDAFKSTDIGLAVGAGMDWMMGQSGVLVFDLRFTISLTDILDNRAVVAEDIAIGPGSMRNWNLTFMVGYGFALGKEAGM
jgi:hypothetical protein